MCGICGIVGYLNEEELNIMNTSIEHRGPDASGTYVDTENFVSLAHRRLSIIDLSENGNQPMISKDNNVIIVFNGEIYNYIEIRNELLEKGYNFATGSDTEVIINAYKEWGTRCLNRFNGMFAFALYDKLQNILFCARDRFGEKPFYYFVKENSFVFASEIKAILKSSKYKKKPNDEIIYDYLLNGLIEHTNDTFFKDIHKLPPASYAIIDCKSCSIKIHKYWDFTVSAEIKTYDEREALEEFLDLFKNSVDLRMRSDVKVGSCLSGGLDSSSIVTMMNAISEGNIETFSSCFEDKKYDERVYISELLKTVEVKPNYIFPNNQQMVADLDELVYYQEEPFSSTGMYAQWCIMKEARKKGVTVLLDGQGADELLGGYRKFRIYFLKELLKKNHYTKAIREAAIGIGQFKTTLNIKDDLFKISRILNIRSKSPVERYINNTFLNSNMSNVQTPENMADALYKDLTMYSLPALLRYEDKNAMRFGIESRVPFLDHRLVEYVCQLPLNTKINNGWSKWILRESMKNRLPNKIAFRRDKMGFVTPQQTWIMANSNFYLDKIIKSSAIDEYVKKSYVINNFNEITSGKTGINLWRVINLSMWLNTFFEK